jgi:hypothetical protein
MLFDARKPPFDGIEAATGYLPGLDQVNKESGMFLLNLGNLGYSVNDLHERAFDRMRAGLEFIQPLVNRRETFTYATEAIVHLAAQLSKTLAHLGAHLLQ